MEELKPCPACGGDDIEEIPGDYDDIQLRCEKCMMCGPVRCDYPSMVKAWNALPRAPEMRADGDQWEFPKARKEVPLVTTYGTASNNGERVALGLSDHIEKRLDQMRHTIDEGSADRGFDYLRSVAAKLGFDVVPKGTGQMHPIAEIRKASEKAQIVYVSADDPGWHVEGWGYAYQARQFPEATHYLEIPPRKE